MERKNRELNLDEMDKISGGGGTINLFLTNHAHIVEISALNFWEQIRPDGSVTTSVPVNMNTVSMAIIEVMHDSFKRNLSLSTFSVVCHIQVYQQIDSKSKSSRFRSSGAFFSFLLFRFPREDKRPRAVFLREPYDQHVVLYPVFTVAG